MAHTFTDEHLQHLFALPNRSTFTGLRNYVMMLTLLDTGIRLKELANLQHSRHSMLLPHIPHTFAKKYVMNGGDIFTLKSILGHERIETTEMYVELFARDLNIQHEKCSPIEHLPRNSPSFMQMKARCVFNERQASAKHSR